MRLGLMRLDLHCSGTDFHILNLTNFSSNRDSSNSMAPPADTVRGKNSSPVSCGLSNRSRSSISSISNVSNTDIDDSIDKISK